MNSHSELCLGETDSGELMQRLSEVHANLAELIHGLSPRLWSKRSSAGVWSPAEIVEHILLVETAMLARVESHLGDVPDMCWQKSIAGKKELLERVIPTEGKVAATAAVSSFVGLDQRDALLRLEAGRLRLEEFLQRTSALPLRALVWPHSLFGPLSAHLWLLYLVLHSKRHLGQLRRELQLLQAQDATATRLA